MSFKVESDFLHNDLRCVVIMTPMGHRCGYVGISKEHPLYKVDYGQQSASLKKENMADEEVNIDTIGLGQMISAMAGKYDEESITPDMFFLVHGGLTYSGGGENSKYPVESDLWWFGYDCAHSGDAKDLSGMDERMREIYSCFNDGVLRSNSYCEEQCKKLAEQLSKIT